ncbi:hypothetical protein C8J57DRAFT_1500406 [Mycena rebaudengoi]|nr:hypothetical protein C8J57DRAFT_1500406 [Mycena rebaudengoi]
MPKAEILRRSRSFWADQRKLRQQVAAAHACKAAAYEAPPSEGNIYTFVPGYSSPIVTAGASGKTISAPDFSKAPSAPSRCWAPAPKLHAGPSAADLKLAQDDAALLVKLTQPKKGDKGYTPSTGSLSPKKAGPSQKTASGRRKASRGPTS